MSSEIKLNHGWFFHQGEVKRFGRLDHNAYYFACKAGGEMGDVERFKKENEWRSVTLPHDWLTEVELSQEEAPAGGYKKRGSAWYYLPLTLDGSHFSFARLVFDGVMGECEVYVNGVLAARNFSGYNRFFCDVGNYLLPDGENVIAVHVNADRWEGWWYEGAGIYRNVRLELFGSSHFEEENCFVRCEEQDGKWYLLCDLTLFGEGEVISALKNDEGETVLESRSTSFKAEISAPLLWSPDKPILYTFEARLLKDGKLWDTFEAKVGFRKIEWDPKRGMFLNGEKTRVKGICCHQDHAGVGAAVGKTLTEYRISRLKELGINAYRCAHHAPSEELLNVCDRQGMLVMVENRHFSTSPDVMCQLEALVKLARNHPSVFLYSLFNEELWQSEERGLKMAKEMRDKVLSLDSSRAVCAAMNGGVLAQKNASEALDIIGINYFIADYEKCHSRTPDKVIVGTENAPTFATRGVYETDKEKQLWTSYGDDYASTFSESLDTTMQAYTEHPFNAGCFVWSGFDYRGEPQPYEWPSVGSHWGIMDTCGFRKDTAWYLAGYYKKELFAHLLPHWNHSDGDNVRVCVFTNADSAELYLNDRHVGSSPVENCRAEWTVPYEKGSIRAVVHRAEESASDKIFTAGEFDRLEFEITEGEDARIINITACDENSVATPFFDGEIKVQALSGRILGVGNGNPNSHHLDAGDRIALFHGKAQVIATGRVRLSLGSRVEEV